MASNPINTNITPPRVQLVDPRTGTITREWYLFFLSLFNLTGAGGSSANLDDLQIVPQDSGLLLSDALSALQAYADTLPSPMAEQVQAQDLSPASTYPVPLDDLAPVAQLPWGATGSFTTADAKTVKVTDGVIVSIT